MIPIMNRYATHSVNIPALTGGLNLRDASNLVGDNQLTDAVNVWYKDGVLKNRPNLTENTNSLYVDAFENVIPIDRIGINTNAANTAVINGKTYMLEVTVRSCEDTSYSQVITLRYRHDKDDVIELGTITPHSLSEGGFHSLSAVAVQHRGNVYVYVRYVQGTYPINEIYVIEKTSEGEYDAPKTAKPYAPLILTNCVSSYTEDVVKYQALRHSTQVEGFNLCGNQYRMQFSAYDFHEDAVKELGDSTYMEYALPYTEKVFIEPQLITIEYTDGDGITHVHTVYVPQINDIQSSYERGTDGLYANCYFTENGVCMVNLSTEAGSRNPALYPKDQHIENNMMITAPCLNPTENMEKVTAMTQAVWYGNTSLGLNGGSRLFLGGNVKENEKALVVWSDFENPLYFPENNYAYVGDKAQGITAFGKQGASLIIFKDREIYSTQYVQGDVTADEIVAQTAIDITTRLAQFPMVQVHALIGCDTPNSVQLCRNRLVWVFNGKIYTMTAQSQYSERNVFEISEMIEKQIKATDLKHACSADYDGFYMLFAKDKVFLLDYNSTGYANVSAYNKHDDANRLIPCYVWELPTEVRQTMVIGDRLIMLTYREEVVPNQFGVDVYINASTFGTSDTDVTYTGEKDINCIAQTKIFDLSQAHNVVVPSVNIGIGNTMNPVTVSFVTDYTESDTHTLLTADRPTLEGTPAHVINRAIVPYTRLCGRVGVRFESVGKMEIYGVTVNYRIAGGKK